MTEKTFDHGQFRRDATVEEIVSEVTGNPAWGFADSPTSFIAYATLNTTYLPPAGAAFWREVGRRLCEIAGIPYGMFLE